MNARYVRVRRGFTAPGMAAAWEVQARQPWQKSWTILRVYTDKPIALADAKLTRRRRFTDREEEMMSAVP